VSGDVMMNIAIPTDKIREFCERYPIHKLALFGSVLRNDFRPDSDIDILVEYEPQASITYLDMAQQEIELSEMFGRKVDLRTAQELSRYFRDKVVQTAEKIYERK
jgi:uncharacterized protein